MATTVVYQPGMSIGRVFDMRTFACGLNIFSRDDIAKTSTVERHSNTVKYSVIKGSSDVNNILGISADISLKAKAGIINVEGLGSYLKEDRSQDNVMEILARAQVETVTVSMDDATPKEGWATNVNGTHYIRSIIYGGDLVVRIRIKGSDARKMEEIKGKLQGGLATHGIIDQKAKAEFKKLEQDIKSSSEIDIEYYSTTPKGEMPRDIDGMLRALDTFKTEVQQLNDNKGVPCKCEIVPLHYLDATIPALLKSSAYISQINSLEEKLEDVQIAKKKLHSFLHEVEDDLEPELETEAHHLEERIDEALDCLMEAISEIDITSPQQTANKIKEAKSSDKMKGAGGFHREVNKLVRTCAGPKIMDSDHSRVKPGVKVVTEDARQMEKNPQNALKQRKWRTMKAMVRAADKLKKEVPEMEFIVVLAYPGSMKFAGSGAMIDNFKNGESLTVGKPAGINYTADTQSEVVDVLTTPPCIDVATPECLGTATTGGQLQEMYNSVRRQLIPDVPQGSKLDVDNNPQPVAREPKRVQKAHDIVTAAGNISGIEPLPTRTTRRRDAARDITASPTRTTRRAAARDVQASQTQDNSTRGPTGSMSVASIRPGTFLYVSIPTQSNRAVPFVTEVTSEDPLRVKYLQPNKAKGSWGFPERDDRDTINSEDIIKVLAAPETKISGSRFMQNLGT